MRTVAAMKKRAADTRNDRMAHLQDPGEPLYSQPLCGAHWIASPTTQNVASVTCRACLALADDLGDPEPWVCGDPDPDNADVDRHPRTAEPYHCGAVWAPRPESER